MALKIEDYLSEMEHWLSADIATYKAQFSTTSSRSPSDFTRAPGVSYPPHLPRQTQGYLSIPLASSILSAMDFCGFCLKGNFKGYSQTEKNIKRFYKEVKGIVGISQPNGNDIRKLIQSCRHGFAHKFFPKHEIGVGYFDYTLDLFISDSSGFVLNTNALITHIIAGLKHILNSSPLFPKMQICYDNYLNQVENGMVTISVGSNLWKRIKRCFKR